MKLRGKIEKNLDLAERLASQTAVNDLSCQLEVSKTTTVVREFLDCQDTEHYRALEKRLIPAWRIYRQISLDNLTEEELLLNRLFHAAWLLLEGAIFLYQGKAVNGHGEDCVLNAEDDLREVDQAVRTKQLACA